MFVSQGVILDELFETLINTYFTKLGLKHLAVSDGVVCLELVREFFANIHSSDKNEGTLKLYVHGVYLDFSPIFAPSTTFSILTPRLLDFFILLLRVGFL